MVRVAFKPTSTIGQEQKTVSRTGRINIYSFTSYRCMSIVIVRVLFLVGEETTMRGKGRHDPCVLPRAVPMVESMVALVLIDALMQHNAQCNLFSNRASSADSIDSDISSQIVEAFPNRLGKQLSGFGV